MTRWLNAPPGAVAALMLLLLLLAGVQTVRLHTLRAECAQAQAAFSASTARSERAAREAESAQRTREQEMRYAADQNVVQLEHELAVARRRRADDAADHQRLRNAAASFARASRSSCSLAAVADPGAAKTTGSDAAVVLAELYAESDAAAGIFAAEADEARIRGLGCERAYAAALGNIR